MGTQMFQKVFRSKGTFNDLRQEAIAVERSSQWKVGCGISESLRISKFCGSEISEVK
jgi:hypothetical protein